MRKKWQIWKITQYNWKWKIKFLKLTVQWWVKEQINLRWKSINELEYRPEKKSLKMKHGMEKGYKIQKQEIQILESKCSA